MNNKVIFLYTELAPYIVRCMEALAEEAAEVIVLAYPINSDAPFDFKESSGKVRYINRANFSNRDIISLLNQEDPEMVVCSGWIDKGYLNALKLFKRNAKKVVALDNQLENGVVANLSIMRARALYRSLFDYAWVPGPPQFEFAKALGFKDDKIWQKFYTADFNHFKELDVNSERTVFPKRFVYVGRYVDFKGVNELFSAFQRLEKHSWELHCAGTGELFDQRPKHPQIHHHGFVQPVDLDNFVRQGGVFLLPSWKEPWGVVVHEFASAGYPIICSDKVGAGSVFLDEGKNGFEIKPKNTQSLLEAMERMTSTTDSILFEMGRFSKKLASSYTISDWVQSAKEILNDE